MYKASSPKPFALAFATALGLLLAMTVLVSGDGLADEKLMVMVLVVLVLLPVLSKVLRGKQISALEPIIPFLVSFTFFMVMRPIYIVFNKDYAIINSAYGGGQTAILPALAYSAIGLVLFYCGYYSPLGKHASKAILRPVANVHPWRLLVWAAGISILGLLLYKVFENQASLTEGNPFSQSTAYLYWAINLLSPGVLFLFWWYRLRSSPLKLVIVVLAALSAIYYFVNLDGRRWHILYLSLVLGASYYLARGTPPSGKVVLIGASLGLLAVAGIGVARDIGEQTTVSFWQHLNVGTVFGRFFSSSGDLIIFDSLTKIIHDVPDSFPYQMGRSLLYIPQHFIPRVLWEGKPFPTETLVNLSLFAGSGPVLSGSGYTYSMVGSFYIEAGLVGIVVGYFVFGLFCRMIWEYELRYHNIGSKMLLAITIPMIVLSQRSGLNVSDMSWYLLHLMPVIIGLSFAAVRRSRLGYDRIVMLSSPVLGRLPERRTPE